MPLQVELWEDLCTDSLRFSTNNRLITVQNVLLLFHTWRTASFAWGASCWTLLSSWRALIKGWWCSAQWVCSSALPVSAFLEAAVRRFWDKVTIICTIRVHLVNTSITLSNDVNLWRFCAALQNHHCWAKLQQLSYHGNLEEVALYTGRMLEVTHCLDVNFFR